MERSIRFFEGGQFGFNSLQMLLQGALETQSMSVDEGVVMMFGSKLLLSQQPQQLLAARHQGPQTLLDLSACRSGSGLEEPAIFSKRGSIEAIRFGKQPLGACEIADLAGVHQSERNLSLVKREQ